MSDKKFAIIGYSGHGFVVADAAIDAGLHLSYYTDLNETLVNPFNLQYLGFEGDMSFAGWQKNIGFILGVGDNYIRRKSAEKVLQQQEDLINVIHPVASLSKHVTVGRGVFIARGACVNAMSVIGDFSILNTSCVVEHECQIASAVHIAPGAVLAGNVKVGENTFIGANAVVKQGIQIGSNVIIGAGAVVLNDIPDGKKVIGNPGKYYEKR